MYDAGTPVPAAYPPDIRCAQRARNFIGADLKDRYPILGSTLPLCGIPPAYAGKSTQGGFPISMVPDHPRLRGEKGSGVIYTASKPGSPPLTRGKGTPLQTKHIAARITPAYAGKRSGIRANHGRVRDHPRLRGEKQDRAREIPAEVGSPPLTRGKDERPLAVLPGSTDHPRLRGEKRTKDRHSTRRKGSPPLTRGKVKETPELKPTQRITPAYAGKRRSRKGWGG